MMLGSHASLWPKTHTVVLGELEGVTKISQRRTVVLGELEGVTKISQRRTVVLGKLKGVTKISQRHTLLSSFTILLLPMHTYGNHSLTTWHDLGDL